MCWYPHILLYSNVCLCVCFWRKFSQQLRSVCGQVCRQDISFSIPVYRSVHSSLQSNDQLTPISSYFVYIYTVLVGLR